MKPSLKSGLLHNIKLQENGMDKMGLLLDSWFLFLDITDCCVHIFVEIQFPPQHPWWSCCTWQVDCVQKQDSSSNKARQTLFYTVTSIKLGVQMSCSWWNLFLKCWTFSLFSCWPYCHCIFAAVYMIKLKIKNMQMIFWVYRSTCKCK